MYKLNFTLRCVVALSGGWGVCYACTTRLIAHRFSLGRLENLPRNPQCIHSHHHAKHKTVTSTKGAPNDAAHGILSCQDFLYSACQSLQVTIVRDSAYKKCASY
ncbi:hypothetical protein BD779DRAFT_878722 [Infundibulicybe gibba]|nr:hypothetical protein BD779DRAFT_878722 [Infundibulicybe gibba]